MKTPIKIASSILLFIILITIITTIHDVVSPFFSGVRIVKFKSCEVEAIDNRQSCFLKKNDWQNCNDRYIEQINVCYNH